MVESGPGRAASILTDIETRIIVKRTGVNSKGRCPSLTEVGKALGINRKLAGQLERSAWEKLCTIIDSPLSSDPKTSGAEITAWLPDSPK